MMTCRELIDFLADYLSGELPAAQRAEFERHLKVCPPCVDYLKTYEQAIKLGKKACCDGEAAGPERGPEKMPEDLVKAILAARKKAET